jgi:hypothetical protein
VSANSKATAPERRSVTTPHQRAPRRCVPLSEPRVGRDIGFAHTY